MDPARFKKIQGIFEEIVVLPPGERASRLTEAVGDDAVLRQEVLSLLDADAAEDSSLDVLDGEDIRGAMGEDIDSLFISGGLAAAETKTTHQPDPEALKAYLETEMSSPTYTIGYLR